MYTYCIYTFLGKLTVGGQSTAVSIPSDFKKELLRTTTKATGEILTKLKHYRSKVLGLVQFLCF